MRRQHVAIGAEPMGRLIYKHSREYGDSNWHKRENLRGVFLMSTFTKLTYHIVFSTKYRAPLICDPFCEQLYEYIGGIIRAQNGHLIEIGGIEDHVHLLANLPPTKSISDAIREIKANSSKWSNECLKHMIRFEWQKGYGTFSVSYSQIEAVRHYIQNQREHHQAKTFEEEYMTLLKLHHVEFEHRYLFENEYCG
jgi:putative transposase